MDAQFIYEDFDLMIEPASLGSYRARVLRSPAGESSPVQFTLPFSPVELDNFVLKFGRRRGRTRGGRPEIAPVKDFGGKLYDTVFKNELRDALLRSLSLTRDRRVGMRLRLRLTSTPELAELPWEFLYDPRLNRFLAQSRRTALVRYLDLPEPSRLLSVEGPLRLLVMISSPSGSDYPKLDVEHEWDVLTGALAQQRAAGRVIVERLAANMSALRQRLRRDEFHVIHFVGHGSYRTDWDDGVLVMEDQNGRPHEVTGEELGSLLDEHDATRLAVLNACEGARSGASGPFTGVAQSLIQQGLPAVVAMQFEITDEAAITFARELYGAIADGYPLEAALAEARGAIRDEGNPIEWGTPVLYSRAPDGRLFDLTERPKVVLGGDRQNQEDADLRASDDAEQQDTQADCDTGFFDVIQAVAGAAEQSPPRANPEASAASRDPRPDRNAIGQATETGSVAGPKGLDRAARLIDDAERVARSITDQRDEEKVKVLVEVAQAVAAIDLDRAARLIADAERIAESIPGKLEPRRASAFGSIARAVAAIDPGRAAPLIPDAERIAQFITDERRKTEALANIAHTVASTDPDRAERIVQSITNESWKAWALVPIAKALAATDPDRAERIAQSMIYEVDEVTALAEVAKAMATIDPDRAAQLIAHAERIAESITDEEDGGDEYDRVKALGEVAKAVASTDPDHAERILRSIADWWYEDEDAAAAVLTEVAKAVAATDPDRAERMAQSVTDEYHKGCALAEVGKAVAATDPDRAARLIGDALLIARSITLEEPEEEQADILSRIAKAAAAISKDRAARLIGKVVRIAQQSDYALAEVAKAVAASDPDRAERIAQSVTNGYYKDCALAEIAKAVATTNPDRAERIAEFITDTYWKVSVLVSIAGTFARNAAPSETAAVAEQTAEVERLRKLIEESESESPSASQRQQSEAELRVAQARLGVATAAQARAQAEFQQEAESVNLANTSEEVTHIVAADSGELTEQTSLSRADSPGSVVADDIWKYAVDVARSFSVDSCKAVAFAEIAESLLISDPDRAMRLLNEAEYFAWAEVDRWGKAWAYTKVSEALAAFDSPRAERLLAEAVRATEKIADGDPRKYSAFWTVAQVLPVLSPDSAERIARSITDRAGETKALARIAEALALSDPDRAEFIANSIPEESQKEWTLAEIAKAWAVADPDRAERIARSIVTGVRKAWLLAEIARLSASFDSVRADRLIGEAENTAHMVKNNQHKMLAFTEAANAIADSHPRAALRLIASAELVMQAIADEEKKQAGLAEIAVSLGRLDAGRAELIARSITDWWYQNKAFARLAENMAFSNPGQAEQIACLVTDDWDRAETLVGIAKEIALSDPDRAERIVEAALAIEQVVWRVLEVVKSIATRYPYHAERIARMISDRSQREKALGEVAKALTTMDPSQADRIAREITDNWQKVQVLISIAKAKR